jgi:hypothetical protein
MPTQINTYRLRVFAALIVARASLPTDRQAARGSVSMTPLGGMHNAPTS